MGEFLLAFAVLLLALCGVFRVKQAVKEKMQPVLCIALEGQEALTEGLIRELVRRIRCFAATEHLLLLVEESDEGTKAIVQRLAGKMVFDFQVIKGKSPELFQAADYEHVEVKLIDIRGQNNFAELSKTMENIFLSDS